jgi:hypothetical protein
MEAEATRAGVITSQDDQNVLGRMFYIKTDRFKKSFVVFFD